MHFTHPHQAHSRIDHIFVPTPSLTLSVSCDILSIPWFDHDVVFIVFTSLYNRPRNRRGFMNDSQLIDPIIQQKISDSLLEYFALNLTPDIFPASLWCSPNTWYIDSIYCSIKKTESLKTYTTFHTQYKSTPSSSLLKDLTDVQTQLDLCLTT